MTSVFCTSTRTATEGSTRASSSTAIIDKKKWPSAPPKASGTSMAMIPNSTSWSINRRGISARSSISRTRGAISASAKDRTLLRSICSSSDSVVSGKGCDVMAIPAAAPMLSLTKAPAEVPRRLCVAS